MPEPDLLDRTARIARDYLAGLDERHVGAQASAAELRSALEMPLPSSGVDPETAIDELARAVAAGLVASAGPRYFGFVIGGSVPAALAADWLTSTWDQNTALYAAAPAACVAEEVCARWIVELFGLPERSSVGFVTGGQMGNFTALAAARHAVLGRVGWDVEERGLGGAPPIRVLVGEEAHVTVVVALRLLGLGAGSAERVGADGQGRMRPEALEAALSRSDGPTIVCAQVGNVDTGAIDPVGEIAEIARRHEAWCHVDGAFGLWAAASPARREQTAGIERADSWVADAHKWLNVPYDSSFAIVRDPEPHRAAMAVTASYLPRSGEERWPAEWVPELSRRARAFPVYAALRSLGRDGVAGIVDSCCERAAEIAGILADVPGAEILNEVTLNQVLVRFDDDDATTEAVIEAVQDDGVCWVAGTTWRGRRAMRISIVNWQTSADDVKRSAASIAAAARGV
ncbi:MAG TPA: aminotransferase class V-fold PLP-dependent enzyme [Solirubrobacterales bacterium]|nr:aminotransferase class V-fold PLP-dependent enzyme [Solirubrobacterales bacterium]